MHVIFASYGNDSIALIKWAHEAGLREVTVAYSDTGWSAAWWSDRVQEAEQWVQSLGFSTARIQSEGMEALIFRKKAWPRGGGGKFQFCTEALKEAPALEWLDAHDPDKEAVCMVGVRREESAHRANFPEWTEASPKHGGRFLHAPLVRHTERERNYLLSRTPFPPLAHRSYECFPCVNANQADLARMDAVDVARVRSLEQRMGTNSKCNERVMFSPARCKGAVGIDAVLEWVNKTDTGQLGFFGSCDGGWCGT